MSGDEPVSLGERRAMKSGNAADWTPRETLLAALRALDNGEIAPVTNVVIIFKTKVDERGDKAEYYRSITSSDTGIAMLARAQFDMLGY